jgi:hypothetical protein
MNITDKTDQNREDFIDQALEQYREAGNNRRCDVQFRGQTLSLEVVRLPPAALLLNHNNSRLQAQLIDHPQQNEVISGPTFATSQQILADLLRKTEKFSRLREDLRQLGQVNPGLITRKGVLINGNTRAVALRDLNVDGIDVAVLPSDALDIDYLDIEMQLQMQRLTHQDYTFTNELLLIAAFLRADKSEDQLGNKMNWPKGTYKRRCAESRQLLVLVNEVRNLTPVPIPYTEIDSKSQHMKDMNKEYQTLLTTNPIAAERLKWGRIIAMFLHVNKDQTRAIKDSFFETLVTDRLQTDGESLKYMKQFQSVSTDDGLSSLLGTPDESPEVIDLKLMAKDIVCKLQTDSGELIQDFPEILSDLRKAIRRAADSSINQGKIVNLELAADRRVRELKIELENVFSELPQLLVNKDFKVNEFSYEVEKLSAVSRQIQEYVSNFSGAKD